MSHGIRKIRRPMDQYNPTNARMHDDSHHRSIRSERVGGCSGAGTLVQRVSCLENEATDVNCALAHQADVINKHGCILEKCCEEKKCCKKEKKCCKKEKKCCKNNQNSIYFSKCKRYN